MGGPVGWLAAAVAAGLLTACSPTSPNDPGTPAPATTTTVSPTTNTAVDSSGPSVQTATTTTATTSTTSTPAVTEPQGTVVPFRPVAPGSAAGQRIGLVASTGSDPFSKAVVESIAAQVKVAGAELISCDPGANATMVLDCASRLATQHVDGWIIVHTGDVGEALCSTGPQSVPLIAIAAAPANCEAAEVGADDRRAGFLIGQELGRTSRLRAGCVNDVLMILADGPTDTASMQRTEGIRAGISTECPALLDGAVLLDAGTQDTAYQAFSNALTAVPDDVDILVAAVDDAVALGAAAAIPGARATHITMAAIGADQRARCGIVANPHWIGDAALFPDRYGEVAVPALLDALQGQEVPANMFIDTTFITADTLDDYYDISECPTQ